MTLENRTSKSGTSENGTSESETSERLECNCNNWGTQYPQLQFLYIFHDGGAIGTPTNSFTEFEMMGTRSSIQEDHKISKCATQIFQGSK